MINLIMNGKNQNNLCIISITFIKCKPTQLQKNINIFLITFSNLSFISFDFELHSLLIMYNYQFNIEIYVQYIFLILFLKF